VLKPYHALLFQFQRDTQRFTKLTNQRALGEKGLDLEIEQLKQAIDVKLAILEGMRGREI
jgi:hypothetical protein